MKFPDFSEFINAINEDEFADMIGGAIGFRIVQTENLLDSSNFSELIKWTIDQSVEASTKISVAYLQTYHQWLQRQFEQFADGQRE